MSLWTWVLEAYERPGTPQAALALQDEHGQNVSFLLWAAWARCDDPGRLAAAADLARRWDAVALGPLREVRRALKPTFEGIDAAAREALREEVKRCELRAEQLLVESLEALGGSREGKVSTLAALRAAAAAWGRPASDEALGALAALTL